MCGIAGILRFSGLTDCDVNTINRMTDLLAHRGPDDRGIYVSPNQPPLIALGHRRLSILDLSSAGHQPMTVQSGRYWIVYNGEIYNFKDLRVLLGKRGWSFRSHTDTEVLLYLYLDYGMTCLSMLEGMFAFAIWDEEERVLFLARDRAGKKPLFYFHDDNKFIFASEIKSLLSHPEIKSKPNSERFLEYLNYRYVPAPNTLFRHIYKMPPATCAYVSVKGMTIQKYWDVQPCNTQRKKTGKENLARELLFRFEHSVEKRMIADVPVGAFLSGGIDSSAVVAVMSEIVGESVKTYSVGFDAPWLSELEYARIVAKCFNTDHHEVVVNPSDFVDNLESIVWYRDLPVSEPADVPIYMMSRIASEKVKVILSGEGSDELLGGYSKYIIDPYTKYFRALPAFIKMPFFKLTNFLPFKFKQIRQVMATADINNDIARALSWFSSVNDSGFHSILSDEVKNSLVFPEEIEGILYFLGYKGSESMAYLDLKYWLPDNLLERADRMTMANSIELRPPFLDHSFIEFCFSLSQELKVNGMSTKILLKNSMKNILPKEIIFRKKIGFTTPISYWFRKELRPWVEDIIFSSKCRQRGMFDHKYLRRIVDDHVSGDRNNWKAIWAVINFELWFKVFFD